MRCRRRREATLIVLLAAKSVDAALTAGVAGIPVAFLVGMVSFFTPCILPLVPGYLSYMSGLSGEALESAQGRRRVLSATLLFVLGFATVFTALGIGATAVGSFLLQNRVWFERIAGAIVIAMGLSFLLPGVMGFMEKEKRPFLSKAPSGLAGAFPLGLAFAVGWTPCVGPGLGTILTLAAAEKSPGMGAALLFSFSLGFGVWFIIAGLAIRRATRALKWFQRRANVLRVVGGTFLLTIGVLLITNQWLKIIAPLRRLVVNYTAPI